MLMGTATHTPPRRPLVACALVGAGFVALRTPPRHRGDALQRRAGPLREHAQGCAVAANRAQGARGGHQTLQGWDRTMASAALHENALANSGMLDSVPLTR